MGVHSHKVFAAVFFQGLFLNLPKKADTAVSSIRTKFTTSPQCPLSHSHWIPLGTASTRTSVNWQPYIFTARCCQAKAWSRDITIYARLLWFKFQIPRPCHSWADSCSFSTAVALTPTGIFQVKANKSVHLWEFIKWFIVITVHFFRYSSWIAHLAGCLITQKGNQVQKALKKKEYKVKS